MKIGAKTDWQKFVLALLTPFIAAAIGGYVTVPAITGWYASLEKPAFQPPDWLFGPAWTVLYLCMGIAFYRIIRGNTYTIEREAATSFFIVQLFLNIAWSIVFFGFHEPFCALLVLAVLLFFVVATMLSMRQVDRVAGYLFVPYVLWMLFASALNIGIVLLN